MARAVDIQPGQVWNDSAGATFGILGPQEADGRFPVRNLATNRETKKGPRALVSLAQGWAQGTNGGPSHQHASAGPAPPPAPPPGYGGYAPPPQPGFMEPTIEELQGFAGYPPHGSLMPPGYGGPPFMPAQGPTSYAPPTFVPSAPLNPRAAPPPRARQAPPPRAPAPRSPAPGAVTPGALYQGPQYYPSELTALIATRLAAMRPDHAHVPGLINREIAAAVVEYRTKRGG